MKPAALIGFPTHSDFVRGNLAGNVRLRVQGETDQKPTDYTVDWVDRDCKRVSIQGTYAGEEIDITGWRIPSTSDSWRYKSRSGLAVDETVEQYVDPGTGSTRTRAHGEIGGQEFYQSDGGALNDRRLGCVDGAQFRFDRQFERGISSVGGEMEGASLGVRRVESQGNRNVYQGSYADVSVHEEMTWTIVR